MEKIDENVLVFTLTYIPTQYDGYKKLSEVGHLCCPRHPHTLVIVKRRLDDLLGWLQGFA